MSRTKYSIVVSIIVIFALLHFSSCQTNTSKSESTEYDIDIALEEYTLNVDEHIRYVNNSDKTLESIRLVSYVGAYTKAGDLADLSSPLAYPFGVNYASLHIERIKVNNINVDISISDAMYMDIPLAIPLRRGRAVDIDLSYTETLPKNRLRYGYNESSLNIGNAFIRVQPAECAKYPFTPIGDPFVNEVASFDVHIECDKVYNVAMTGGYTASQNNDRYIYDSKADRVRDYAIVLSNSEHVYTDTHNGVAITYMTDRPENGANIRVVKNCLDIFSRLYGKYPYKTLTIVENDFLEGGMEYPTLVYINKSLSGVTLEHTIIHEIAHQWWYGIVGVNENIDYFVDEGMAELSTYLYYVYNGEKKYAEAFMKRIHDTYMLEVVRYGEQGKIGMPLGELSDREYYVLGYLKSPLILYNVMQELGRSRFVAIVHNMVERYQYDIVTTEEFVECFSGCEAKLHRYIEGNIE